MTRRAVALPERDPWLLDDQPVLQFGAVFGGDRRDALRRAEGRASDQWASGRGVSAEITFFNTSAVKDIPSLCMCIALLDSLLRKCADVQWEESWTEEGVSWKKPEYIDK